jgi:hypothetical protein
MAKSPPRKNAAVRIDQDAVDLANIVAAYRKMTLTEYVSQVVRAQATRDHDEEIARSKAREPKPK